MKLFISKPCHQDWSKMTPNEKGSFCQACCKTVHDLTAKTTEEIIDLISNAKKICVRIRSNELVPAPLAVRGSYGRLRAFACALMLASGSLLFSCNNHPDDHVIMGDIAPVEDTLKAPVTDTASGQKDTAAITQSTITSQDTTSHKKKKSSEVKMNEEQQDVQQPRRHPYPLPVEPRWTGGSKEELQKFISANTKYPEEARKNKVTGTVMVSFIVKADGKATDYKVFRGLGYGCDEEALRVAKLLKWEPGKQGGEVSDMEYSVAVMFGE